MRDPGGRPLASVEVRPHGGFATRVPGTPARTDAQGRYRIHPVTGSLIGNQAAGWNLSVGVCAEAVENGNPEGLLPWKDVQVPRQPGTVVALDFVLDQAALEKRSGNGGNL